MAMRGVPLPDPLTAGTILHNTRDAAHPVVLAAGSTVTTPGWPSALLLGNGSWGWAL